MRAEMPKNIGPNMTAQTLCDLLGERPDLVHHPNLAFFKLFLHKFVVPQEGTRFPSAHSHRGGGLGEGEGTERRAPTSPEEMSDSDATTMEPRSLNTSLSRQPSTYDEFEGIANKVDRRRERKAASAREYRRREKLEHCTLELKIAELREEIFTLTGNAVEDRSELFSMANIQFDESALELQPSMMPSKGSTAPRLQRKAISARRHRLVKKARESALQAEVARLTELRDRARGGTELPQSVVAPAESAEDKAGADGLALLARAGSCDAAIDAGVPASASCWREEAAAPSGCGRREENAPRRPELGRRTLSALQGAMHAFTPSDAALSSPPSKGVSLPLPATSEHMFAAGRMHAFLRAQLPMHPMAAPHFRWPEYMASAPRMFVNGID
ncbi:hypothetical protein AB1Y20_009473 [Prymnesium parvum]|uniref:BZIP domain-containing protein n=1 Tax=Prymnesium parvum TaxID=97485 RepID=A0AB34K0T1_PRYPA|mmetsp:Transcript_21257/g.51060  ORF Transcript_21257/g.51060 Transcript_21257/m.51060 type:complete len:387 (+) Transcript_21257:70-1230(+)